jgi:AcrR family transcriptional regulator
MSSASLREDQAQAVRRRILDAALVVIEGGGEPTMRSVATAAQIAERTIYRYFATRDELQAALVPDLRARASAPMPASMSELERYARDLFTRFDENPRLVRALVTGPWAQEHFSRTRRANLAALQALVDEAFPGATASDRRSAAASLRVPLSGAGWLYLMHCGFDREAAIDHVHWLVRTVVEKLERSGVSDARRRSRQARPR